MCSTANITTLDNLLGLLHFNLFVIFLRRWVLVDENDAFVSQRKDPKLALVVPHFEDGKYLCLNAPGMETLKVDIELKVDKDKEEYKRIQ